MAMLRGYHERGPAVACVVPGDPRNRFLPEKKDLLAAYSKWFGCKNRGGDGGTCGHVRCLRCGGVKPEEVTRLVKCTNVARIREAGVPGHSAGTIVMDVDLGE